MTLSGCSVCLPTLPPSFFTPYPAPFIILMQPNWKKRKNSRSHFINCCYVLKHISSLKHLDVFVIEHFFLSPSEISYSVCLCGCARKAYKMCMCVCVYLTDTFSAQGDVQSSKLKHVEWAIDGSINWYAVLVMGSVTSLSLFYGLNLLYFHPISNISLPSGCN